MTVEHISENPLDWNKCCSKCYEVSDARFEEVCGDTNCSCHSKECCWKCEGKSHPLQVSGWCPCHKAPERTAKIEAAAKDFAERFEPVMKELAEEEAPEISMVSIDVKPVKKLEFEAPTIEDIDKAASLLPKEAPEKGSVTRLSNSLVFQFDATPKEVHIPTEAPTDESWVPSFEQFLLGDFVDGLHIPRSKEQWIEFISSLLKAENEKAREEGKKGMYPIAKEDTQATFRAGKSEAYATVRKFVLGQTDLRDPHTQNYKIVDAHQLVCFIDEQ